MDVSELERLMEMVSRANISELTLRQGSNRLTLRKPQHGAAGAYPTADGNAANAEAEIEGALGDDEAGEAVTLVTAGLVGVFRHVKPVIGLGAQVTAGQVIGVIEAMKISNDVTATVDGRVVEALVEDSMPVEYGQELFALHPDVPKT